ncbi:MAG TPA: TonB-dependent receptor [Gemmatimonadaceae bacterium]|nr:TonB-dependent receptor [Gemmatimonadaceae bacterium]
MSLPPGARSAIRLAVLTLGCSASLTAQDTLARRLPAVVVTRDIGRSPLELPFAISTVRPDSLAPGVSHTLVEQSLALVPGLTVANRNNPSQDTRVSIRGFGARSAFGVRSLRILRDGMPLTLPDGQTPIDYLDLESVGQVETIRGSASALYGNASGGVVDLRSVAPPSAPFAVQARSWAGANDMRRFVGLFGGSVAGTSYIGNMGRTQTNGDRAYSHQRLTNAFTRVSANVRGFDVALLGLGLDMPLAENPGALTRAQFDTSPDIADPLSVTRRARKEVHQVQIGALVDRALARDGELQVQLYGAGRSLFNPLTFAIVGVDRHSAGAAARTTFAATTGALHHRLTAGVDVQRLSDFRKNWANCNGVATPTANCASVGVEKGVLQLDQQELVTSLGPYVRDELWIRRVAATVGVRADNTVFELRDAFLTDGRDDSGQRHMRAISPMTGVSFRLGQSHSAYASVSTAFETPTTTELGNQADGSAGLNTDLRPQHSTTLELGEKGSLVGTVQYDLALFDTRVRDELIPFDIGNGRTAFRNAGRTSRRGAEAGLTTTTGPLSLAAAYTYSHFRFRDFVSGTTQLAGRVIPGVPEQQLQTTATLRATRGFVVAEWLAKSRVQVNDANAAAAPGYAIVNARVGAWVTRARPSVVPVFGVQNLFDRKYVGSVAVNAAGTVVTGKFYEPGPRQTWFVGLSAATVPW